MKKLLEILKHKRPYGSGGEITCIAKHLDIIPNMKADNFGNRILTIGDKPNVLFSCHTDTVHSTNGIQIIRHNKKERLLYKNDGECLGADDGAGMWLMIQLINKKIPGLYIFHRGEECGGLGSFYIAKETPEILENINIAIAFDRRGTKDIITTQSGGKCCSQDFCDSLAKQLNMGHSSAIGTFTDTANYTKIVEECTNISIGYYKEHSKKEHLDYMYLSKLATKMMQIDYSKLVVARKKGDTGYKSIRISSCIKNYGTSDLCETLDHQDIVSFVMNNPLLAADMLYDQGLTQAEVNLVMAPYGLNKMKDW